MKKTALFAILTLTVFVLAACSGKEKAAEIDEEAKAATVAAETEAAVSETADAAGSGTVDAAAINAIVEGLELSEPASLGTVTELGKYTGLDLTAAAHVDMNDVDVEEYIETNILPNFTEEVSGPIQNGDTANIDYVGKKDGVAFEGGTSQGYDLKIGSGSFIDGFESGLIGTSAGETVDLNLTFPENYSAEELAGKAVVFTVTVNKVTRTRSLDDALAKEIGDYGSAAALRAEVKEMLQQQQDLMEREELYVEAISQVLDSSSIEVSEEAITYTTNSYIKNYAEQVSVSYGIDFGSLLSMYGYSIEEFMDSYKTYAEESVKQRLALQEIAARENITASEEDIAAFAKAYGYESDMLKDKVGEELLRELALEDKANAFIVEHSNVTYTAAE